LSEVCQQDSALQRHMARFMTAPESGAAKEAERGQ